MSSIPRPKYAAAGPGAAGVALLHFDGTNGSTTITDFYSANVWTAQGTGQLDTSDVKFGTAALKPGTGGVKSVNAVWNQFTGTDFTIECWVKSAVTGAFQAVWDFIHSTNGHTIYLESDSGNNLHWSCFDSGFATIFNRTTGISPTMVNGSWHHIAWVRSGSVHTFYLDGISKDTFTSSTGINTTGDVFVGCSNFGGLSSPWQGHIDEFRVSKLAQYTANFTPPSAPFSS